MVRTTSLAMASHFAEDATTLCYMLQLQLTDGYTIYTLTDHSEDLVYDMADGWGPFTYYSGTGILPSDIVLTSSLDVSNFEVGGPISPGSARVSPFIGKEINRDDVLGGVFTRAYAKLFMVNWADLSMGHIPIMAGKVAQARVEGSAFVLEIRNQNDDLNQTIGRLLTPYCTATYGDTQCGVVRTAYPATVTAVTDALKFTVNLGGTHPDDFFNFGEVVWDASWLGGYTFEVFDYVGATGAVELFSATPFLPEVGDTLTLYRGCSKLRKSDIVGVPTCFTNANVERFRGFPEVPGSDLYLKIAVAGSGGA